MSKGIKTTTRPLYGLMAEFESAEELVKAAQQAAGAGYQLCEAYSPFPVEGLDDALKLPPSRVPLVMFGGGIIGAFLGYSMQYYAAVISYPLNIGGRPLSSWPALVPVTVEITILCAILSGLVSLFIFTKLPRVYHPVFNNPDFYRASQDSFFLCLRAKDKRFVFVEAEQFLRNLSPKSVRVVEK